MTRWMLFCLAFLGLQDAPKETTDDLKKCVEAVLEAAKAPDEKLDALIKDFVIPDHAAWFKKIFGNEPGKVVSEEYGAQFENNLPEGRNLFVGCIKEGRTEVRAIKLKDEKDPEATGLQKSVLKAMKEPVALYTVKITKPGEASGLSLWSFVFVDGKFRLAGKMRKLTQVETPEQKDEKAILELLKGLSKAEGEFREADRDGNEVMDYWVGDVASLYMMKGKKLELIGEKLANADRTIEKPEPISGYYFRALEAYYEDGKRKIYNEKEGRNPTRYGFAAFPDSPKAGKWTYILTEKGLIRKDLGGLCPLDGPKDPAADGWTEVK